MLTQCEINDGGEDKKVDEADTPAERQRKKAELIAKGQKFFSYSYGPITGTKLAIEDITDIDEDKENYGEHQLVRADANVMYASIQDRNWGRESNERDESDVWDDRGALKGATTFDEYAKARKAKPNRRNPSQS